MEAEVLTLPYRAQLSAAVLSNPAAICSRGAIREAKMWRWAMYAARSKLLVVKNPFGFLSVRMWACMEVLNVSRHMCHSPDRLYQTLPMLVREVSVAPIHVGGLRSDFS